MGSSCPRGPSVWPSCTLELVGGAFRAGVNSVLKAGEGVMSQGASSGAGWLFEALVGVIARISSIRVLLSLILQ